MRERVVVTGLGMVTPLGVGAGETWKRLCDGQVAACDACGIHRGELACDRVAAVTGFDVRCCSRSAQLPRLSSMIQFAVAAAREAFADARLGGIDRTRIGCVLGNSLGGVSVYEEALPALIARGPRRVSPYLAISMYYAGSVGEISIELDLLGPMTLVATGETASTDAIGLAADWLAEGEADVILAGGTESPLTPHCLAAYERIGVLSRPGPGRASSCRPFQEDADGFVLGEGAAVLVLETHTSACRRDARVYGELLAATEGWLEEGPGAGAAVAATIQRALVQAQIGPEDVDLISANGDGLPAHDHAELDAFCSVFGARAVRVAVMAIKPLLGHSIAASGAIEAGALLLALAEQRLPPIGGEGRPMTCNVDLRSADRSCAALRTGLALSIGIQGRIGALVFRTLAEDEVPSCG